MDVKEGVASFRVGEAPHETNLRCRRKLKNLKICMRNPSIVAKPGNCMTKSSIVALIISETDMARSIRVVFLIKNSDLIKNIYISWGRKRKELKFFT